MVAFNLLAALSLSASTATLVAAHPHPFGSRTESAPLPQRWYHDEDHPVHALFRRHPINGKRQTAPHVGTPAWSGQYPQGTPDVNALPQEWINALEQAIDEGSIPAIPPSTSTNGEAPVYPPGVNENRNNATVCAATDRVCRIPQDIWDGPDGYFGVGFDDGPTDASPRLYDFLGEQNVSSTHYMIGENILANRGAFRQAYDDLGADIAVHTYTHPYMTTQTNEEVLGQLGWTMQIIYDLTDGKVPRYWRPPYGDIDSRVSAIAREVFGMTAVMWNQDTNDWSMASNPPGTSMDAIQHDMEGWLTGPKSPGLIVLEHELTPETVQAFINAWPLIGQNGWIAVSQAQLDNSTGVYQDGQEDDGVFNSYLTTSTTSESESATPTSETASASSSGTTEGLQAQSNTSDGITSFVYPSIISLGVLVGGILALM